MKKISKRTCSKRPVAVDLDGYCDWFEKKSKTVIKKECSNCRYLKNDEETKKETGSTVKKTKKKPEDNPKE